ncbi:MAG: hypothetical protein E3J78_00560 [Candidatus Cloacimonadota bacterium]|nr:MAG: hypothetical protein E3J78_00560 [Candidatus Cloacimonadota bacterium]
MIQYEKSRIVRTSVRLFSSRWKFIPFLKHNGTCISIVSVSGYLEREDMKRIGRIFDNNLRMGINRFIVNLSAVNHIHYRDVDLLVGLKEKVDRNAGEVKFVIEKAYLIDIFFFVGWPFVDDVYPTEKHAVESFRKEHFLPRRVNDSGAYSRSSERSN